MYFRVTISITILPDHTIAPLPGAQPHLNCMQKPGLTARFSHNLPPGRMFDCTLHATQNGREKVTPLACLACPHCCPAACHAVVQFSPLDSPHPTPAKRAR